MSISPPKALAPKKLSFSSRSGHGPSSPLGDNPLGAALEHEILAEKAGTYARLLRRLEEALAALREFERAHDPVSLTADPGPEDPGLREGGLTGRRAVAPASPRPDEQNVASEYNHLLAAAGEALWHVVIQRDLCGFRRHDLFYKEYGIPAAVRLRMGLVSRG